LTQKRLATEDDPGALREQVDALQRELDRRVHLEQELHELRAAQGQQDAASNELFRLLVASVRDYAIFTLDPQGCIETWNAAAARVLGYTAEEIMGRHFSAFFTDEDVRAGKCELDLEVTTETGRFEDEGWRRRKDGSRFWANVVTAAMRDRTGRLVGFGKVMRDLTDRKQAENERERFRQFVESVRDYAMFILDPAGRVATWNIGAERIKGYRADEIIGRHFSTFYSEADVRAGTCDLAFERATRDGRFEDEGWRVRKDGSRFWASVLITAIRDAAGKLVGFSKVTRDLTERKRNEDERAAALAAEQANRAKDEFLATLGHELRSPLAPIVTALQLIKLRGDTRSSREYQVIERQVQHMMHLVDDLLDVSRIAHGKLELHKQLVDVRGAIARALEIASPLFEQRRHHVEIKAPQRALMVEGDEARLTQVFANLLTNAAKYTDPGGHIFVLVRQAEGQIVTEVRDDGVGIDSELLPRVFDLFVQGKQRADRGAGGLGLGLSLVRTLVQLHGGRVEARSNGPRSGSSFTVCLPAVDRAVAAETDASVPTAFVPAPVKRRLLIVDDNEDARMLLADLLRTLGHDVLAVEDGPRALELVAAFTPDVAILDIGLPGMDGYELATLLRQALSPTSVRLIALSGYHPPTEQAGSRGARFDRYLVKPVDVRRLIETISELTC
jgi:hypothetical protein